MYLGDKLRVISGKYKGKNIMGFDIKGTRPTMDRVKESMFAMIQNNIKDSICLDLFAGSGSLGIEAISNGAKCCYFVEKNNEIYEVLKKNLSDVDNSTLLKKDYLEALEYFKNYKIRFDLIFLDPPYKMNLIGEILNIIYDNNILNDNGLVICEYENEKILNDRLTLIKRKKYGTKNVDIYKE